MLINSNLWVPGGNTIRTMTTSKTCLAQAVLTEEFSRGFGIYDLGQLIGILSIHNDPEIELHDKFMTITTVDGWSKTRFYYADRSTIVEPPQKDISISREDNVCFRLGAEDVKKLTRSAIALQNPCICIRSRPGEEYIEMATVNNSMDTANEHSIRVHNDASYSDLDFEYVLKMMNIMLISTSYDVMLSPKKVVQFDGVVGDATRVSYWIPTEKESRLVET